MSRPVTQEEFTLMKRQLRWMKPERVAIKVQRHIAIVLKAQASKDYEHYKRIVRAEHPPIKNSLADRVSQLEEDIEKLRKEVERLIAELYD